MVPALGKLGELVSSVQQHDPNVGCRQTRKTLPFCSQNANRDENAMAMSHGAAALAGERPRGETGRGRHAGYQTTAECMNTCPSCCPWGTAPSGMGSHLALLSVRTGSAYRKGSGDRQAARLTHNKTHCAKKAPLVRPQDRAPLSPRPGQPAVVSTCQGEERDIFCPGQPAHPDRQGLF